MSRLVFLAISAFISTIFALFREAPTEIVEPVAKPAHIPAYEGEGGQEPTIEYLSSTTTTTTTVPISTTTTEPAPTTTLPSGQCEEWYPTALEAGWSADRLQKLGRIMWAESRCLPDVKGRGSYGLAQMQYNAHWVWMRDEFGISDASALYDPLLNLQTALWLAEYAETHYGCWAQPWYMSGDWC